MLFDTTFLIDLEREVKRSQSGRAHSFLLRNPESPLYISVVSVGEFAEGFETVAQQGCLKCLHYYTVLNIDGNIAWAASRIARRLRSLGSAIGENDVWIAATAMYYNLDLVTNNGQHFQKVDGLRVILY